ncbi:MAG TPA: DUF4199 domain-containing protein [Pyrinomonadaceae bacterium]|nr:DUF4199 domain-containing protein [Pyrinomonadaceae bacterium]
MKKIVLTFGLISGAISAALMMGTVRFIDQIGFDRGVIVGYTAIVLSFLLVFFGIRSYRENVGNGYISFGRAFQVGILIALISSIIYVLTWEIVFHNWLYDFPEKYTSYVIEKARASGASADDIARQTNDMNSLWASYRGSFLVRAAYTFLEPFPVGLLITLVSALILKRRAKQVPA